MAVIIDAYTGTIAGQAAYTPCHGGRTYSRILEGLGIRAPVAFCVQKLRESVISPNVKDYYKSIGDEIQKLEGVYFQTLQRDDRITLTKNETFTNHAYALEKVGKPLEDLSGIPMKDLQFQSDSWGMNCLVSRYFDGVSAPEEGDLVVYYDQRGDIVHSGIYHSNSPPNWRSPSGGTVESRWMNGGNGTPYVFQHDFFFLPKQCGDIAKFYRLKTTLPPAKALVKHEGGSMYEVIDGSFQFVKNEANQIIRTKIDEAYNVLHLVRTFPQMEYVSDIKKLSGRCFTYAFEKIFQSNYVEVRSKVLLQGDILGCNPSKFITKYFTPVSTPQVGDLAVYSTSTGDRRHFGVYVGEDLIESKWGASEVIRHPPFYVESDSGNTLTYYRLKT